MLFRSLCGSAVAGLFAVSILVPLGAAMVHADDGISGWHRYKENNVQILALQRYLNAQGFILAEEGPGAPGNETSYFGTRTLVALKRFQTSAGLPATGFFGPMTLLYVREHPAVASVPDPTQGPSDAVAPDTTVPQPLIPFPKLLPLAATPGFGGGGGSSSSSSNSASDTSAPSAPSMLLARGTSASTVALSWSAASDNVAVTRYRVYRDGAQAGETSGTSYTDTGLSATTTYRYTVTALDAAGNESAASGASKTITGVWSDGHAGASSASVQRGSLFGSYIMRPAWDVAGVDYAVGLSTTTSLADPATISITGVTVTAASHLVRITGSDITISGYDFSLDGGWQLYVTGSNPTITENNFKIGANSQPPIVLAGTGGATIRHNTIDGANLNTVYSALITINGTGTYTIEYNWLKNAYSDFMNGGASSQSQVIRFNLFENCGSGSAFGAHADFLQDYGASNVFPSVNVSFNTFVQDGYALTAQGFNMAPNQGPTYTRFDAIALSNNTLALTKTASSTTNVSYAFIIDPSVVNGTALVSDNYLDQTGILYDWKRTDSQAHGPYAGTTTLQRNFEMKTGDSLSGEGTSYPTRVTLTTPTSGAAVAGTVSLAATADSSATVTSVQFKVDNAALGSADTSAPYATTWDSTSVSDGSHTIAAVGIDSNGIYGTSSISVLVENNAPSISTISSGAPTTTGTTISWDTNTPSDSTVVYGTSASYGSSTSSASMVTSHSMEVTGLIPLTTYHYAVVSTDALGHTSTSSDRTFTTDTSSTYSGPGDIVSSASAWWGLRAYSRAKTGTAAIIVTCGGTNYTISSLISGALDTATLSSDCGSNTIYVRQFYDQTGNGWHLTQTTQANQATITLNCVGSLPCLTSSTNSTYTVSSLTVASPYTFTFAGQQSAYTAQANILSDVTSQSIVFQNAANTIRTYDGAAVNHTVSDAAWHSMVVRLGNKNSNLFSLDNASSTFTGGSGQPSLGGGTVAVFSYRTNGFGYRGSGLEAGLWAASFSDASTTLMHSNMSTYWGW